MSGYPGQMEPWQNRPSVISCWEHEMFAIDTTGGEVIVLIPQTGGGLFLNQVPMCIPRACRLTRLCMTWAFSSSSEELFQVQLNKSTDCFATPPDTFSLEEIPVGQGNFVLNCFCADFNVLFDECDGWWPRIDFGASGVLFPLFRLIFHFELR